MSFFLWAHPVHTCRIPQYWNYIASFVVIAEYTCTCMRTG